MYVFRYKKYVFLDPLAGAVTKTHTTLETEKEEKPFDAPLSITKREQLERQVHTHRTHTLRYMCSLKNWRPERLFQRALQTG